MSDKSNSFEESYLSDEFIEDDKNLEKKNEQKNLIKNYIINKLFHFYNINEKLMFLKKRKYNNKNYDNSNYFQEYYIINSNWMKNYLKFYNYQKISKLIKREANGELKLENLYKGVELNDIKENPGENDEIKKNLKLIKFEPTKENIPKNVYVDDISDKIIEYYDNFILLDKDLYNEIRQDDKNPENPYYIYAFENKIKICLVDNIFIYKINENILGIGILPEFLDDNEMLIFKINFLLILFYDYKRDKDEQFNSNTEIKEIFRSGDLETYLVLKRFIRFENENLFRQIDMKIVNRKIGLLYNIGNFSKEIYWKRTKEEYDKKQELLEQMKKDRISSEIKKREEKEKKYKILKLKEKKENEKIKEAEKEKMEKMRKKENELKSESEKLKKRIIIDCERAQRNEQFKQELKKFRGKSNDTKVKFILKINSISNGNDLIPVINKKYTILPEIPNNNNINNNTININNNKNNNHFKENTSDLKLSGINRDNEKRIDIEQKLNSPKANSKEKEKENPNNNISKNQNGQNKVLTIKNNKNNNLFQEIIKQEKYEVYEKPNKKNENEFKGSVEKYRKGILYLANKNKNIAIKNYIIKIGNKEKENLIYKLDRKQKFFNVQKNKKRIDKIKDERRRKRYEVKNKNFALKRNADEDIKNLIDNILRGHDP